MPGVQAAEAAFFAGRFPDAERRYEEAIAELRAQGNVLGVGEAMVSLSLLHGFRGETGRARMLLDEVVELLEREEPGAELARAYAQIAREHMLSGRWKECLQWSQKALEPAEKLAVDDVAVMVRQFRGVSRCELGDFGGLDDLRQALERSLALGLGQETVRAHINLGGQVWFTEGPAKGLEVHRAGIAFGERRGLMGPVMWTKGESLWMLFDLGEWDELIGLADELIAWEEHHGESYFGVMALSYKARVLVQRGAVHQAAALSEKFVMRARKIEDPQILAPALGIGAVIELARGDQSAALDLVEEFRAVTHEQPAYRADHLADTVRVCCAAKRVEPAKKLLDGLKVAMARHRYELLTAEAVVTEAEGRFEPAAERYARVVERWAEYGFVLEHGLALLGLGRCLLALSRPVEAANPLREAREVFTGLGARPLVAETDALLAGHRESARAAE